MNGMKRALAYASRKKSKTILLLLLFIVANTTILCTLSVMTASDKVKLKYSMTQIERITGLIFALTLFTSVIVTEMKNY